MTHRSEVMIKHVRMRDPGRSRGESNSGYSLFRDRLRGKEKHRMREMEKKWLMGGWGWNEWRTGSYREKIDCHRRDKINTQKREEQTKRGKSKKQQMKIAAGEYGSQNSSNIEIKFYHNTENAVVNIINKITVNELKRYVHMHIPDIGDVYENGIITKDRLIYIGHLILVSYIHLSSFNSIAWLKSLLHNY